MRLTPFYTPWKHLDCKALIQKNWVVKIIEKYWWESNKVIKFHYLSKQNYWVFLILVYLCNVRYSWNSNSLVDSSEVYFRYIHLIYADRKNTGISPARKRTKVCRRFKPSPYMAISLIFFIFPFLWFFKNLNPSINNGGWHYVIPT